MIARFIGVTCYERDEMLCEDAACIAAGCRLKASMTDPGPCIGETDKAGKVSQLDEAFERYREQKFGIWAGYPVDAYTHFGAGYEAALAVTRQEREPVAWSAGVKAAADLVSDMPFFDRALQRDLVERIGALALSPQKGEQHG